MLESVSRKERDRDGNFKVTHFIPSLCHLTGATEEMKQDRTRGRELIKKTALPPGDRISKIAASVKSMVQNAVCHALPASAVACPMYARAPSAEGQCRIERSLVQAPAATGAVRDQHLPERSGLYACVYPKEGLIFTKGTVGKIFDFQKKWENVFWSVICTRISGPSGHWEGVVPIWIAKQWNTIGCGLLALLGGGGKFRGGGGAFHFSNCWRNFPPPRNVLCS